MANPSKAAIVKINDLVRTPSGRTARCEDINADGSRALRDIVTAEQFDMRPSLLTIIMAAPIRPWKKRTL